MQMWDLGRKIIETCAVISEKVASTHDLKVSRGRIHQGSCGILSLSLIRRISLISATFSDDTRKLENLCASSRLWLQCSTAANYVLLTAFSIQMNLL